MFRPAAWYLLVDGLQRADTALSLSLLSHSPPSKCPRHVLLSTGSLAACLCACLAGREAPYLCAREAQVCPRHTHSVPPAGILAEGGLGMGSTGETVCGIIKQEQNRKQNNVFLPLSFLPLALIIFPLSNSTSTLIKLASGREVWQTWRSSLVYFLITQ